jgi:hypothetical protein
MLLRTESAVPSVIRSAQELLSQGIAAKSSHLLDEVSLPISSEGVTFDMAQSAAWIDSDHFAVGRWDGSLSLFRFSESRQKGPLIAVSASCPSSEGVQMIVHIGASMFVTSNDDSSVTVWKLTNLPTQLIQVDSLSYDIELGASVSGEIVNGVLVLGHANGLLSLWKRQNDSNFVQSATIDLRAARPTNPWGLQHIRGLSRVDVAGTEAAVITGSENGEICVVDCVSGRVLSRRVYNAAAQRGINAIAMSGHELLVANCSVSAEDKNLWLYRVNPSTAGVEDLGSTDLRIDPDAAQVFNFAVIWAEDSVGRCFFASTQEGALWMGRVTDNRIGVIGYQRVTAPLGAALAYSRDGNLAFVAYDLFEFKTGASTDGGQSRDS